MKKLFLFCLLLFLFCGNLVYAASYSDNTNAEDNNYPPNTICLDNPLGPQDPDINVLIGGVIRAILGIIGSISLAMFTYGGFVWLTSAGNTEKVQKGKAIFTWGTVGMIIILTAAAFVRFVLGIFG